ncbi:6-phosphogluconolactonase [Marinobacter sp.]|uniref:6-phosphogluconolactonase n=1 Tax=Marinobacter sp. TaxID=50741 RepID=UPI0035629FFE
MPDLKLPAGIETCFMDSPESVGEALAEDIAQLLRNRLAEADEATLVVSGGSTPLPFFRALREKSLNWARVKVVLADERWVPECDPASNTALVKRYLLQGAAADAQFIAFRYSGEDAVKALPDLEAAIADLTLPVDALVLGMGNDGHTASLFPDAPELPVAMNRQERRRVLVMTPPSQQHQRVTLTFPVLAQARFIALHLKGEDKLETLGRASKTPADWKSMPIRAFLSSGLTVYWSP